jgi:hypothetical protein
MPPKLNASAAIGKLKSWMGEGWAAGKAAYNHELVQSAKPIFQAARDSLMKGDMVTQAAAYGVVGGGVGYALSDDPKKGIRNGVALGVLGAAGHRLWKSPGLRNSFKEYGGVLNRHAAGNPEFGAVSSMASKKLMNKGAARAYESGLKRRFAGAAESGAAETVAAAAPAAPFIGPTIPDDMQAYYSRLNAAPGSSTERYATGYASPIDISSAGAAQEASGMYGRAALPGHYYR